METTERMAKTVLTGKTVLAVKTVQMDRMVQMGRMETTALHHSLLPALNQVESIAPTAVRLLKVASMTTVTIHSQ